MIKVLNPGLFTTIQDLGRAGFLAFGVSMAGAADDYACRAANLLVGNDENAPLLEMTMFGGGYEFCRDALAGLGGADMAAKLDGTPLANWASHKIKRGQTLELSFAEGGCRTYLAVAGAFKAEQAMGSYSTHTRSKIGGMAGRVLKKGDFLATGEKAAGRPMRLPAGLCPAARPPLLRVLPGPQADAFFGDAFAVLESGEYTIEADSDRMGYRLQGPAIRHKTSADIISDALIGGAVQIPGSGQPMIMLNDCQTTGGYTKLCFVITPDLPVLAQCRPGDRLRFKAITEAEAEAALQEYKGRLDRLREFVKKRARARGLRLTVNSRLYEIEIEEA
jgi:biotin-dependent carboxylase-like uncharacterized protein